MNQALSSATTAYGFERGLVDVQYRAAGASEALPERAQLDPAELLQAPPLAGLLGGGLQARLESALGPTVPDRALLRPAPFTAALTEARDALREAARGRDPGQARALDAARRLLDDELALRDLAAMYRGALQQG